MQWTAFDIRGGLQINCTLSFLIARVDKVGYTGGELMVTIVCFHKGKKEFRFVKEVKS